MRFNALIVAAFLFVTSTAVIAAPKNTSALDQFDTDKDGTLSFDEISAAAGTKFDSLDTDHDGTLSKSEVKAARISAKDFKSNDTDSDGTIDKTEYMALVKTRFAAADADHDNTLSKAELSSPSGHALLRLIQ